MRHRRGGAPIDREGAVAASWVTPWRPLVVNRDDLAARILAAEPNAVTEITEDELAFIRSVSSGWLEPYRRAACERRRRLSDGDVLREVWGQ